MKNLQAKYAQVLKTQKRKRNRKIKNVTYAEKLSYELGNNF